MSRLLVDVVLVVLAGVGLWLSFPAWDLWWLLVPSMALVISRVDCSSPSRAAFLAMVFGCAFWLPHTDWSLPATGGWLPWVALAGSQVVFLALWGAATALTRVWQWSRHPLGEALAVATTWVAVEQVRSHFPWSGFPWGNLAYPQVDAPIGRLAVVGGEVLVSFLVVVVAVLARRALAMHVGLERPGWWSRPLCLVGALALFVTPILIPLSQSQESGALRVGIAQGNIELPALQTYSEEGRVTRNHADQMQSLIDEGAPVDLYVWGEASLDRDPRRSAVVAHTVSDVVNRAQAPTIVGFPEYGEDFRYNWIGLWYPGTGLDPTFYGKQIPVPFGEFIPLRDIISLLATEAAQVSVDLAPVDNIAFMRVRLADGRDVPLAVGICFEVAYEDLLAEGVMAGGQMIVVPTNNYHFRDRAESVQQAQILRFRAMEFSRSAVQASTTGVSMLVRPDGSVQAVSGTMQAAHLAGELPLRTSLTPAAVLGPWPSWLVMCAGAVLVLASMARLVQVRFEDRAARGRRFAGAAGSAGRGDRGSSRRSSASTGRGSVRSGQ
ncbi:apolipoprotein N-acyltransferase [Schaalia sp. 19OD2882]|uniref:apolipoprotein N-acyltransferase n=1 Tax=Schaalia sp. 19OD2882 TaxID=2794089 RepID=UPI001C1F0F18|nr:apolipoprotein N-acyltransferase [Schaalia sp. 19OD2882]QWW18684.1 apolipoprotein N-acyltransferase [Schaalia sp. 19OD2882]